MKTINVDGLPDPVVQSLEAVVQSFRAQLSTTPEQTAAGQFLKQAAGSWSGADNELDQWLDEMQQGQKQVRQEPML